MARLENHRESPACPTTPARSSRTERNSSPAPYVLNGGVERRAPLSGAERSWMRMPRTRNAGTLVFLWLIFGMAMGRETRAQDGDKPKPADQTAGKPGKPNEQEDKKPEG